MPASAAISVASTPGTPGTRYLEDLYLHARGRSRRVSAALEAVTAAPTDLEAEVISFENTLGDFLASITLAAVERLKLVAIIAPDYENEYLTSLKPRQVDDFIRPIFEASGIADDFIPWHEAFPNYEEPGIGERA